MQSVHRTTSHHPRRRAGLSIVELLLALVISAVLLVAIAAALNTTFHAYATAAESASTQSSARLVMQRLMTMIRSGVLHDAYDPDDESVTLADPTQPAVRSVGIEMFDLEGQLVRVWWAANASYGDADVGDLRYALGSGVPGPLLERVRVLRTDDGEPYIFTLASRSSSTGLLLLRATVDLSVEPGADATLALESVRGASGVVRLVGSTMPRRNLE
jgi:hypothetical protein